MARTLPSHGNNIGSTPLSFAKYLLYKIINMFKLDLKTLYYPSIRLINSRRILDEFHCDLSYITSSVFRNLVSSGRDINSKSISVLIDTGSWTSSYSYERVSEYIKENRRPFKWIMLLQLNDNEIEFKCFTDDKEYLDAITSDIKTFREERNKAIEASKKEQQEKLEKEFGELNGESINKINESRWERYSAIADESRDWGTIVPPTRMTWGWLAEEMFQHEQPQTNNQYN